MITYIDLWWLETVVAVICAIAAFVLVKMNQQLCAALILASIALAFAIIGLIHCFIACAACGMTL